MAEGDRLYDGSVDFLGGQDASKIPDRIAENAYFAGVNVSVHKGVLKPRGGWFKRNLVFDDSKYTLPSQIKKSYRDIFYPGKFQAVIAYTLGRNKMIILVVAGIIYMVNRDTWEVSVLNVADGSTLDESAPRINWAYAGKFLVLFDFPAFPVLIEEGQARRANPEDLECPVAVQGTYNQNRLVIVNDGTEFTAGDPVGSLSAPNAPASFLELLTPASPYYGQVFKLPTEDNNTPITAVTFLQVNDTSLGIGPLIAATSKGIWSFGTHQPRSEWEGSQFGSCLLYNVGIAGPQAVCNVNSDLFFVSSEGQVRSLSMSKSAQGGWARESLSGEVSNWLKFWDADLVKYASVSYFKNKIFVTANPYRVIAYTRDGTETLDYAHGGFVVMETDGIATLGNTSPPVWAGLWTGVRPMAAVVSDDRMFVVSKDEQSQNALYEFIPDTTYDTDGKNIRYITSKVYTKEYDFKNAFVNKALQSIHFNLDSVKGDFSLGVKYKPGHSADYLPWHTFTHKAPWRTCKVPEVNQMLGFAGHLIRDLTLGAETAQGCNPVTRDYYEVFRKVQLELTITGRYWELHEFMITAIEQAQNTTESVCGEFPIVEVLNSCTDDWKYDLFGGCTSHAT